jgi:hypothetical protein
MPRPHEDLERHRDVDHRPGGPLIQLLPGAWCAIEVAHVAKDRVGAALSAYETLIEKARTSAVKARAAAIFRSVNDRRVIALIDLGGHDAFLHLKSAWDDHHLTAEHRAVAESSSLALYQLAVSAGGTILDPETKDAYAFEHVAREPERVRAIVGAITAAPGFFGALVFGTDDATASALVYRFDHAADIEAFRASPAAQRILGPVGAEGESFVAVHPVKTFGVGPQREETSDSGLLPPGGSGR